MRNEENKNINNNNKNFWKKFIIIFIFTLIFLSLFLTLIFIFLFFIHSSSMQKTDNKSNIVNLHKVKKIKINEPRGLYTKIVPLDNNKFLIYGGENGRYRDLKGTIPEIFNFRTKRSKVLPTLDYFLSKSNCKFKDGKIFFINSNGNVVLFNPKTLQFELKSKIDTDKKYCSNLGTLIKQYNDTNVYIINRSITEILDYNIKNDTYTEQETNLNNNYRQCLFKSNSELICLEDNYIYEYNIKENNYKKILQEKTYNNGSIFYVNNKFIIFPKSIYPKEQIYIEVIDFDKKINRTLVPTILSSLGAYVVSDSKIIFSGGTVFDTSNNKVYLPKENEIEENKKIDKIASDINRINKNTYISVGCMLVGIYVPEIRILKIEAKEKE